MDADVDVCKRNFTELTNNFSANGNCAANRSAVGGINAERELALIGENDVGLSRCSSRAIVVPRHANIYRDISSERLAIARHQFPEEEADKEARRKMRSNRGNNVAKSRANSTDTRPCRSRLSRYSRRRYFIEEISPLSVPPTRGEGAFGWGRGRVGVLNVVHRRDASVPATVSRDTLDDRLSGCARQRG